MGLWKGVRLEAFDVLQLVQVSSVPLHGTAHLLFFTELGIQNIVTGTLPGINRIKQKTGVVHI